MVVKGHDDVALEEDDGIYEKGDEFKSFHCQANHPMSRQALPTGFLSVWLKCVVSSLLHDRILPTALFPAVQLVYGRALRLLPATVCCIQHGLQTLTEAFCREATAKKTGKELVLPRDGPCLRVELPYTYLMAWFALHCPAIIKPGEEPSKTTTSHTSTVTRTRGGKRIT